MLPRSLNEIYELRRDFYICLDKDKSLPLCSLHIVWKTKRDPFPRRQIEKYSEKRDRQKINKLLPKEAGALGVNRVFALTYHPEYFKHLDLRTLIK